MTAIIDCEMHVHASCSLTPLLYYLLDWRQFLYDPGISSGSAYQCMFVSIHLRSDIRSVYYETVHVSE